MRDMLHPVGHLRRKVRVMSKHTSKLDEMAAEREYRLTQPPPETGTFYTADFTEDDDSSLPSWCRTNRLHTPGRPGARPPSNTCARHAK